MRRRDIPKVLLASAAGASLPATGTNAQTCTLPCYPRSAAEQSADVTPSDDTYPPGNVKRYGATGNGSDDDSDAVEQAISAQSQPNGGTVFFPAGRYRVTRGFTLPRSVQLIGEGSPCGGTAAEEHPYSIILAQFNGDLFTFTGSAGATEGSGGGVENLRLVQDSGSGITATGAGTAVKLVGISLSSRPSWIKIRNVVIEYGVNRDSWTWGIDVDGTSIGSGGTVLDLWFSQVSMHTASSLGGAMRIRAGTAKVFDCAFYDVAGNVTISGTGSSPSRSVLLFNTDISGTLALDHAIDVSVFGGVITSITNTVNTAGNCFLLPVRLVNPFTNNAGAACGMITHSTQAFATHAGSFRLSHPLTLTNGQTIYGISDSGATAYGIAKVNAANQVALSPDGADIQWGVPRIALGGGAQAVLGTTGGGGPTTAVQSGWMRVVDTSGSVCWLPVWR